MVQNDEGERRHSWVTKDDFDRLEKKIDAALVMLVGNGKPDDSIAFRLKELEKAEIERREREKETIRDWKGMLLPSIRDFVYAAILLGGYYVAGHAFGVFH